MGETVEVVKLAIQGGASVLLGLAVLALWRKLGERERKLDSLHKANNANQDRLIRILLGQREEDCDERRAEPDSE